MLKQTAETWLQNTLGEQAYFRDGQWEAIAALVEQRQRVLVVQRTGWGKSLVYFMATRLLREQGAGVTLLISPLLALMRNQIEAAKGWGVRAMTLNSTNAEDHHVIEQAVLTGQVDLLLISPERLANDRFQSQVWSTLKDQVGLLVIDEAHCISDWGHDFRPNYRRIMSILEDLPSSTPVLGTTATANDRVVKDVSAIIGSGMNIERGALTRESLALYVYPQAQDHAERLVLLAHLLKSIPGSGIIYCTTTRDCEVVADWLQQQGFNVKAYYSNVEGEDREALEQQLLNNELKALVASVALGMGFDKPDLHFVIHYQQPGNIIGYYQQIGRAGRNLDQAHVILMHGAGDEDIQRHFIETAFPKPVHVDAAITALQQSDLTRNDLQAHVNVQYGTLEKILTHLEVEKIIRKEGSRYQLIAPDTRPNYEHWAMITQQRYDEMAQMQAYIHHDQCLMRFIAQALDDPSNPQPCGRCKNCRRSESKYTPNREEIETARAFLRGGKPLLFEPRKRWAAGLKSKTVIEFVNEKGLALCSYYAAGWSEQVKQGRFTHNHYSDELVTASAQALQAYWQTLKNPPQWITSIPSRRRPMLVASFAQRLAQAVNLPYQAVLEHVNLHEEQATMRNSYQQVQNVLEAFGVSEKTSPSPVLLVDDIADSKWTLTVVGELLRRKGSGAVHPFVLATTGSE